DPQAYWKLWDEISSSARRCEDADALADLLDAAVMHAATPGHRLRSAEFVEMLVIRQPACVLAGMDRMSDAYAFMRSLREPLLFSAPELLAALAHAEVDGDMHKQRRRAQEALERYR